MGSSGGNSISCSQLFHKQNTTRLDIPQAIVQSMIAIKYKRIISLLYLVNISMADSTKQKPKPLELDILKDPIITEFKKQIRKGRPSTTEELDKFMRGLELSEKGLELSESKLPIRSSPITLPKSLPKSLSRMQSFSPLTTPSLTKSSSGSSGAAGQGMFDGGKSRRTRKRKSKRRKRKKRKTKRKRKTRRKKSNKRKRKTRKRKRYKK
jgi:hypothetical protein